nr:ORF66 nuclear egress membrane protein [Ovine gammaherpesvirus 2]
MACVVCTTCSTFSAWADDSSSLEAAHVDLEPGVWQLYRQLLALLRIEHTAFVNFVFFDTPSKDLPPVFREEALKVWLEKLAANFPCSYPEKHWRLFFHGLYMCYYLVVYLLLFPSPVILKFTKSFFKGEQQFHLLGNFSWVISKFTEYVFKKNCGHPVFKLNETALDSYMFLKKKLKRQFCATQLTVPALFTRLGESEQFLSQGHVSVSTQGNSLAAALRGCCAEVPCGSPFESMVRNLAFRTALRHPYCVIPISEQSPNIVVQLREKILSVSILACAIRVPLINEQVRSLVRAKKNHTYYVYCGECKHCLNFGKGKFLKVNFNPTHVFYCRDQKEKQCNVCGTTGRINCSFCGSANIRTAPLTQCLSGMPIVRAIVANNAALMLDNTQKSADFILPCLGTSAKCEGSVLHRLRLSQLLYLTSSVSNLLCAKCQS